MLAQRARVLARMLEPALRCASGGGRHERRGHAELRPPKRVIVVVVLAYISGVVDIVAGVLLILLRYDDSVRASGDALPVTLWGTGMILIGLLTIAMASGLTRGRNIARIFVTALVAISTIVDVVDLVAARATAARGGRSASAVVVTALIILALWAGRSAEFFRRARTLPAA